jgi:hypothetical protein
VKQRNELTLELTGLVYVRALLESTGASLDEISAHTAAIERVRAELERLEVAAA